MSIRLVAHLGVNHTFAISLGNHCSKQALMLIFLHFWIIPLIYFSFSWLLWLRSLNIVLTRSCDDGLSCLVPKFKGKAFSIVLMIYCEFYRLFCGCPFPSRMKVVFEITTFCLQWGHVHVCTCKEIFRRYMCNTNQINFWVNQMLYSWTMVYS